MASCTAELKLRRLLHTLGRKHTSSTNGIGPLALRLESVVNGDIVLAKQMVNTALARISRGKCGICVNPECQVKIPAKLLEERPWEIFCSKRCKNHTSGAPQEVARSAPLYVSSAD